MNETDVKVLLKESKDRLKVLKSINSSDTNEYNVEKAIEEMKENIKHYKKMLKVFKEEHKQLCESLEKEFPKFITEDYDIETLKAFNKVMNDDSLSEIEKSTWYMLIANYKK